MRLAGLGPTLQADVEADIALTATWRRKSIRYQQFTKFQGRVGNRGGTGGVQLDGASLPGGDQ